MAFKLVYICLGSNLGNREQNIAGALGSLEENRIHVTAQSSLYETEPQDVADQPWFLNQVVACQTTYFPLQLLSILQRIERDLGRTRNETTIRRGPRVIDLDILLYDSVTMDTPELTIPHPRMLQRRFVLDPLLELAPEVKYPGQDKPLKSYLHGLTGQKIRKLN